MFNIRREQGRLAEVEGAVRGFIELYPAIPAWRGALALLLIELGRPDEARAEFEAVAEGGFAAFPRDANWLIAITLMAEVCGALGDAARARELYARSSPTRAATCVVGRNATCNGCASRLLGHPGGGARRVRAGRAPLRGGAGDARARWARGRCTRARRSRTRRCCWRGARAGDAMRARELLAERDRRRRRARGWSPLAERGAGAW